MNSSAIQNLLEQGYIFITKILVIILYHYLVYTS